jgi:hypothetical protein
MFLIIYKQISVLVLVKLNNYFFSHQDIVAYRPAASQMTTAVAMWQHGKHTSTTIELLLETRCFLCGLRRDHCYAAVRYTCISNNRGAVFSVLSMPKSYLEDNWGESQMSVENWVLYGKLWR